MSVAATLLVTAGWAIAQATAPPANLPAQSIGAHDLLAISVYGAPELTRSVRVEGDGAIRLPMLEQRIPVAGLLPGEVEGAIAAALRAGQILVEPIVTVGIVEYHSRPISVSGAVRRPLTFQAHGGVTLLDAIARAEGLSAEAGAEILVSSRRPQAGEPAKVKRIAVQGLFDAADPVLNLALEGGEEIRVPEAGRVFVVGNVRRPGAYPLRDAGQTSVLKLLALAEGVAPYAARQAYVMRGGTGAGANREIPVELRKILERKSPDVALLSNDILYVPDNRGRRAALTALERAIGFGSATASGVLIWSRAR